MNQEKNKRSVAINTQRKTQNNDRIEKIQRTLAVVNKIPFVTVSATIAEPSENAWADKDIEITTKQQAVTSKVMEYLNQIDELIDESNCHSFLKLGAFLEIKYMQIDKNYLSQRLQLAYKESGVDFDFHDCDTDEEEFFAFFDAKISDVVKEKEGLQKYDPEYILVFLEHIVNTYLNNRVLLNDGRTGEIVLINKQKLSRPLIKLEDDFLDLSTHPDIMIEKIL